MHAIKKTIAIDGTRAMPLPDVDEQPEAFDKAVEDIEIALEEALEQFKQQVWHRHGMQIVVEVKD